MRQPGRPLPEGPPGHDALSPCHARSDKECTPCWLAHALASFHSRSGKECSSERATPARPRGCSSRAYFTRATTLLSPTLVCCPVRLAKISSRCSQSSPSYSPSPLVAIVPCTCHFRAFIVSSPMSGHSSRGLIAPACVGTTQAAHQGSPRHVERAVQRRRHERTHHVLLVGQHQDERVAHQRVVGYLLRSRAGGVGTRVRAAPNRSRPRCPAAGGDAPGTPPWRGRCGRGPSSRRRR